MKQLHKGALALALVLTSVLGYAGETPKKAKEILVESKTVFFDYDDSKILDVAVISSIKESVGSLKAGSRVRIEGFADERGTHEYNMGLAQRRINTVLKIMKKNGLKDGMYDVIVYGEDETTSKYDGHMNADGVGPDEGWAADRRVTYHIIAPI